MKKLKHLIWFACSVLFVSCAVHNIPTTAKPNLHVQPNITTAFVDLNGNFYPDNWEQVIGPYERTSSLFLSAQKKSILPVLMGFEKQKLAEYNNTLKSKKRVFIFVHGYNNSAADSKINYDNLQKKLPIDPVNDEIVEFYWDGLVADNSLSSAKIWFNATGYSQMAGEFALRSILNEIHNKDIYIISHSRGASVVLSALSNPPFDPHFFRDTAALGIPIGNKVPLAENGNRIVCIMLAPAIGEIDFTQENNINNFRSFSGQLKAIHITINQNDPVLNKFIGLAGHFNPTTLGHDISAFNNLLPTYSYLTYDDFTGQHGHAFQLYLDNPKFLNMVKKYIH